MVIHAGKNNNRISITRQLINELVESWTGT